MQEKIYVLTTVYLKWKYDSNLITEKKKKTPILALILITKKANSINAGENLIIIYGIIYSIFEVQLLVT